jgi:hypothetical protein
VVALDADRHAGARLDRPAVDLKLVAATPESASLAFRATVTSLLFHAVGADAVVTGAWRSMLTGSETAVAALPARSETELEAVSARPSPSIVESAGHVPSRPDSGSPHVQRMMTSPLYQPEPFATAVGVPESDGAVLSMLMPPTVAVAELPALSVAVPLTD